MKQMWPARGGVLALALLAGLGACTDSPVEPAAPRAAGGEADARASGFSVADAFVTVSGGAAFTCGTTVDGAAHCWGDNTFGQLGTGGFEGETRPARVAGLPAAWTASAGAAHACALTRSGQVFCWGDNSLGQLGDGTTAGSAVPVRVQAPAGVRFVSVESGDGAAHTCALGSDRAAYCWGDNTFGQLGTGSTAPSAVPVRVQSGGMTFAAVSGSGFAHSCAISSTAEAYCWGDNAAGQLGDGTTLPRPLPTRVASDRRYASLVTGWYHSCGASFLSGAFCWGDNNAGKLGNGTSAGLSTVPVAVAGSLGFGRVDPGSDHSCARRIDGEAFCWGQGFLGQLGDGTAQDSPVPVRVANPSEPAAAAAPSFNRASEGGSPTARGAAAWCAARADRARIAACS